MNFVESRLLGVQLDETGQEAVLSLVAATGAKFAVHLHGVERLLIGEMRQQNVVEEMRRWAGGVPSAELREAAFALMTGVAEKDCGLGLAAIAHGVVDRVARKEIELIEITAIFGAQVLAICASMEVLS